MAFDKTTLSLLLALFLSTGVCTAQKPPSPAAAEPSVQGASPAYHFEDYAPIIKKNIFGFLSTPGQAEDNDTKIPAELAALPAANSQAVLQPAASLFLTGIVEIGETRKAIIENTSEGIGYYVKTGDQVIEYTVTSISGDKVTMESPMGTLELILEENAARPEPAGEPGAKEPTDRPVPEMLPYPQRGRLGGQ